jgi:hypothetical protein
MCLRLKSENDKGHIGLTGLGQKAAAPPGITRPYGFTQSRLMYNGGMASLGLQNLTPGDEALLASVDIDTKEQFLKLGAEKVYHLLREAGAKLDHEIIYRLRGAERETDWQILADRAKRRSKSRFADIDEA